MACNEHLIGKKQLSCRYPARYCVQSNYEQSDILPKTESEAIGMEILWCPCEGTPWSRTGREGEIFSLQSGLIFNNAKELWT